MSEHRQTCPTCGIPVSESDVRCPNCGEDLTAPPPAPVTPDATGEQAEQQSAPAGSTGRFCTQCGAPVVAGGRFCSSCGAPLAGDTVSGRTKEERSSKGHGTRSVSKSARKNPQVPAEGKAQLQMNTTSWIIILVSAVLLTAVIALNIPRSADQPSAIADQPETVEQNTVDMAQLEALRQAADENPDDAAAQLQYANALHDARMLDQAIVRYKTYLDTHPDDTDARVDLGICYFEQKEYDAAIKEMELAVEKNPQHQLGNYNLGIVNLNAGNKDAAKRWFEKARDLNPSSPTGQSAAAILQEHFQSN